MAKEAGQTVFPLALRSWVGEAPAPVGKARAVARARSPLCARAYDVTPVLPADGRFRLLPSKVGYSVTLSPDGIGTQSPGAEVLRSSRFHRDSLRMTIWIAPGRGQTHCLACLRPNARVICQSGDVAPDTPDEVRTGDVRGPSRSVASPERTGLPLPLCQRGRGN